MKRTFLTLAVVLGCSQAAQPSHSESTPIREGHLASGAPSDLSRTASASAPEAPEAPPVVQLAPSASPNLAPAASGVAPTPNAETIARKVRVKNIGLHIGGGPNDAATKDPIRLSIEPFFEDFGRCFAQSGQLQDGDVSIDLRVGKAGGAPQKVSKPRTALKSLDFERCLVGVFEKIPFRKPKNGDTVASYSLRFESN